jgi:hypothetical protein
MNKVEMTKLILELISQDKLVLCESVFGEPGQGKVIEPLLFIEASDRIEKFLSKKGIE